MKNRLAGVSTRAFVPALAIALAACSNDDGGGSGDGGGGGAGNRYDVEVRRTSHGIPHVKANDFGSLGYGLGHAYSQDNFCLLADAVVTVNGERSRYFGPDGTTSVAFGTVRNLDSDFFFRANIDIAALRQGYAQGSAEVRDLMGGYVAGVNRYLRDRGRANLPAECRQAAWVREITVDDLMRLVEEKAIQASSGALLTSIAAAQPPAPQQASLQPRSGTQPGGSERLAQTQTPVEPQSLALLERFAYKPASASNGWAFGKDATDSGFGLLLGNPHFPWTGTNRFYQMHLVVPGRLDVMGASISQFPIVNIGFNKDVAWTHTVSTARRFTLFELDIDPADATAYRVDGISKKMQARTLTVEARTAAGTTETRSRTLYSTDFGPLLVLPSAGLTWTTGKAYAIRDANRNNTRMADTWLRINRATNTAAIHDAIVQEQGIPWVNTIATDRAGDAMYADVSVTPNVPDAKLAACAPSPAAAVLLRAAGLVVLNGSRTSCNWDVDPAARAPGLYPMAAMPVLRRTDYVANSNDSFWLSNPAQRLTGFPAIIGPTDTSQRFRTRMGLTEIGRRLGGVDGLPGNKFSLPALQSILFSNRNYSGLLLADELVALCRATPGVTIASGRTVDLTAACGIVAAWDRTSNLDSRGSHLFREFWRRARAIPNVHAVAFDPADPVNTPRGLNTANATVREAILRAFGEAVDALGGLGIALDARLGDVQAVIRNGERIPIHGGDEYEGVLNKMEVTPVAAGGYTPTDGSSYIQTVTFDGRGPVAEAVLTYSQSTDPASPWYADQTRLFSAKQWVRLPYHEEDIARDPNLSSVRLVE